MDRDESERSSSIPFSKRVSCSFKNVGVGSLLLVLELDDKFDFSNDIVRTVSCVEILLGLL